tara:strand:- start:7803 stop:8639 length:837 start_codon:yes stop_codon:yes gene_type:complete
MLVNEQALRNLIRESIKEAKRQNPRVLDEGLLDILKGLVSKLFGMLGGELEAAATQSAGDLTSASGTVAQEIQGELELPEPKQWADLQPKENNTDKAIWALTVVRVFVDMEGPREEAITAIQDAWQVKSLAPPSEEAASEWESGEDAALLEGLYKGIGAFKGWLVWLSAHFESAQAAADGIDETAKLSEMMSQVVPAAEFIIGSVVPGLESAASAVKATGYEGDYVSDLQLMSAGAENIGKAAQQLSDHFKELEAMADEAAKKSEEASVGDAAEGMPA